MSSSAGADYWSARAQPQVPRAPQGHPDARRHCLPARSAYTRYFLVLLPRFRRVADAKLDRAAVEDAIKQREANRQPEPDYFSQRHRPIEPLNDVDSSGERTPLPTAASLRRAGGESHSPKPSWGNLSVSGFFNASMLSLRSASSSSPSSPDRTPSTTRPASLGAASASPATSPGFAKSPLRAQQSVPSAMHHHQDGEHAASAGARSKTSPTVTFGGTSVALIPSKSPAPQAVLSQDEKPAARKRVAISLNEAFNLQSVFPRSRLCPLGADTDPRSPPLTTANPCPGG